MALASAGAFFMAFVTWLKFRRFRSINQIRSGIDYLQALVRSSFSDEYTVEEPKRLTRRR